MSTQVVPFNENTLPAHLAQSGSSSLNEMAAAFASVAFPSISIKGKVFHIVRGDTRTLITRPKANPSDPTEPASAVEVAIINIQRAKTYYEDSYVEGTEAKPTCFSNDGITPDALAEDSQCETCALCPHNAWGSGTNDKGESTKGKACADVQRMAVASPTNLDDAFLMRVPPASLKGLAEVAKQLSAKSIPLNGVVMRVSFDTDAAAPTLVFKPSGYLSAEGFAKAQAMQDTDLVRAIVGKKGGTPTAQAKPTAKSAEIAPAEKPAPAATTAEKPAPAKKTKKQLAAEALAEAEAEEAAAGSTGGFGGVAETAPAATTTPAASTAKVVTSEGFDAELDALLGA